MLPSPVIPLVGICMLEEEEQDDKILYHEFMDAHGLLCELADELEKINNEKITHVGVGFAWNKQEVKVVEFLSIKSMNIKTLTESEDGGVEIRGTMLSNEVGIYAARIIPIKN